MITNTPILTILIFLPLLSAFSGLLLRKNNKTLSKVISILTSIVMFGMSIGLWYNFNFSDNALQFSENKNWIKSYNICYSLGIDALSLYLIVLTVFLSLIFLLAILNGSKKNKECFMALVLLIEGLLIGAYSSNNLFLFYLFFEASLVPIFIIIGSWGDKDRVYASFKFFLYSLLGSLLMLLAIIYIQVTIGSSDITDLGILLPQQAENIQKILWWGFFFSFAIKTPLWPLHTWLPDAYVQAPNTGSAILSGLLSNLGVYGFLKISLPLLPVASYEYSNFVLLLSTISVLYGSFIAISQHNIKRMIAFSSMAHMGFVTAGIFSASLQGLEGSIIQMISHSLIAAGLFLSLGMLFNRAKSQEISFYQGVVNKMPSYAFVFMILTMAAVALPGTSGFIGEFTVLLSTFSYNRLYAFFMALSMVLAPSYMLWLIAKTIFGEIDKKSLENLTDLTLIEKAYLYPIIILILTIGIYPAIITDGLSLQIEKVLSLLNNNINIINNLD